MVILALLEIPEPHAADAIIETVCGGFPFASVCGVPRSESSRRAEPR